jgi:type VI secretion system protein ImpJ
MLLSPHHFQQNQQYWEGQLRRMVTVLSPNFWGVGTLSIDYAALLEGEVNILRIMAILPDGLVVDYDANIDDPLTVSLGDISSNAVTVQLVLPIQVPGSASERSEIQRYFSRDDQPCIDENTGDNEKVLPRLVPKFSLQLTDRVSSRYIGLPLFRVLKPEGGSVQLDPNYCPPLLSIGADKRRAGNEDIVGPKPIQQQAKELALVIRHKAMQLAGVAEDGEHLGHHINLRHHRWIRAMVQDLAAFELVADSSDSTPRALYESLIRMVGPISELAPNNIPPRFPPYCHDDCLPALKQVMHYIKTQVNRVNLNYTTLSFEQKRDGVFTLLFEKSWEGKDLIIEVCPTNNGSREGVKNWIESSRIASANLHKDLSDRRLLGAKAHFIERDNKSEIVPAPNNALFRIQSDKRFMSSEAKLVIVATSRKVQEDRPQTILVHIAHE